MQLNKKTIVRAALCVAVVTALGYSFTVKSETKLLPFQGKLTDANGQVIPDKAIVVQFKMYDAPVGGNAKWNGEVQMLTVNGGLVNTTLGTKASLKNVDFSSPTYLEITIDANNDGKIGPEDPPLLPRQSIIPAVYAVQAGEAKNAKKLDGYDWSVVFSNGDPVAGAINGAKLAAGSVTSTQIGKEAVTSTQIANNTITAQQIKDSTITSAKLASGSVTRESLIKEIRDSLVPPGTIIAFGGENVPDGWLPCDGRGLSSKDYPALYQAISTNWGSGVHWEGDTIVQTPGCDFSLPELQGTFLRGWNHGFQGWMRDPDAERRITNLNGAKGDHVGSYQQDALQDHQHRVRWGTAGGPGGWGTRGSDNFSGSNPGGDGFTDHVAQDIVNARISGETRPVNVYVNYIIKY